MSTLNAALRSLFDLVNAPLGGLDPMWGIALWSIPIAIFALFVFKKTSNQDKITATKDKIFACLFEIRLFNDNLRAIMRAQGEILRHVITYQRLSLVPMVWILPPLLLMMVHLHAFYGYRALQPGDQALLKIDLEESWPQTLGVSANRPPLEIELPEGVEAETDTVWFSAINQAALRLKALEPGQYEARIRLGDDEYSKSVTVGDRVVPLSFTRPDQSFLGQLEWPAEAPLPAESAIKEIVLTYKPAQLSLFGFESEWEFAWMVYFFIFTMIIAFALRKRMGVEF